MKKYGKSFEDIKKIKQNFFSSNDEIADRLKQIDNCYKQQSKREKCKNCCTKLNENLINFERKGIKYYICPKCKQVNGEYQDTNDFCKFIYEDQQQEYSINYSSKDKEAYENRTKKIYLPKAKFLIESLRENKANPLELNYCDIGAGSGYFINAMIKCGIENIWGYEVSKNQVNYAKIIVGEKIKHFQLQEIVPTITSIKTDVITAIGVLEHLQNPHDFLQAINVNTNIKYLYISVPLFSLSSFLQLVFPEVMERQLAGGHTHLYSESSLKYLATKYNLKIISEWWFGTDMMDLYRSISVILSKKGYSEGFINEWITYFSQIIDPLQLVIDEKQLSSEVHILFTKSTN